MRENITYIRPEKGLGSSISHLFRNLQGWLIQDRTGANLRDNFEQYGELFGVYSFRDFKTMAKKFLEEALASKDPKYTIVRLPENKVGVDYNCEFRGVYDRDGQPVAFFRPNYVQLGYPNKERELEDWKSGKTYLPA